MAHFYIPTRPLRSRAAILVLIVLQLWLLQHLLSKHPVSLSRIRVGLFPPAPKAHIRDAGSGGHKVVVVPPRKPGPRVISNANKKKSKSDSKKSNSNSKEQQKLTLEDLAADPAYHGPGSTDATTPAKPGTSYAVQISTNASAEQHTYLPNGLLIPNPLAQHPIFDLVARARAQWEAKLSRASKTLPQAVDEYRRRYHRAPPRGFERWWAWCVAHGVQLPDEYDQIHTDLEPFWALTPTRLNDISRTASRREGMYTIRCRRGKRGNRRCTYKIQDKGLNAEGRLVAFQRANAQLELIKAVEDVLEDVEAVFYSHDVPWQFVGHDYKGSLEEAAAVGEYYDAQEAASFDRTHGWAAACAPHKPLRAQEKDKLPDLDTLWAAPKSFVWDHTAVMDPCTNPALVHLMGFLSSHGSGPGPSFELFPVMAMCKTRLHSDVLGVSAEAWTTDVGDDPAWEDKTDDRLLWRGKTTGIYFKEGVPWNISQRINLVEHAERTRGTLPVTPLTQQLQPVGAPRNRTWTDLNDQLMDVAFVDEPIQCDPGVCKTLKKHYIFAERKDWSQANRYKYLLDIDGNGWSARFKRLMSTNSAVLKSTMFPEWYSARIQPWVHYIPVKPDLTDLYDVMTFFQADNDPLAREIAMTGREWSHTFWRKEDMVAYQFRLLLELARLLAPDRQKASYHARGSDAEADEES